MVNIRSLDGGLATILEKYVGDIDGDPLWTAKFVAMKPDDIIKAHLDFLNAGAEMIETFSYQAFVQGYMKYMNLSEEQALSYVRKAGELAIEAKNRYLKENPGANIDVVGSVGPYGAFLHDGSEYTGAYPDSITAEIIKDTQRPRVRELAKAGVKILAFETIPLKREAEAIVELLGEFPDMKAWISFSCRDNKCISSGEDFKETAVHIYNKNPKQIIAVGVNCLNPAFVHDLFSGINKGRDEKNLIPLVVYSNSGEEFTVGEGYKWSSNEPAKPLYSFVKDWVDLGARYVGGCCRTTLKDVKEIRQEVDKLRAA